jgi:hypothetical protein
MQAFSTRSITDNSMHTRTIQGIIAGKIATHGHFAWSRRPRLHCLTAYASSHSPGSCPLWTIHKNWVPGLRSGDSPFEVGGWTEQWPLWQQWRPRRLRHDCSIIQTLTNWLFASGNIACTVLPYRSWFPAHLLAVRNTEMRPINTILELNVLLSVTM